MFCKTPLGNGCYRANDVQRVAHGRVIQAWGLVYMENPAAIVDLGSKPCQ